jgi:hypothetical protein
MLNALTPDILFEREYNNIVDIEAPKKLRRGVIGPRCAYELSQGPDRKNPGRKIFKIRLVVVDNNSKTYRCVFPYDQTFGSMDMAEDHIATLRGQYDRRVVYTWTLDCADEFGKPAL